MSSQVKFYDFKNYDISLFNQIFTLEKKAACIKVRK